MDYKEKIAVLKRYKDAVRMAEYYQNEIDQYRATMEQAKSQKVDDMPHARGRNTDLSDYIVKLEEMQSKMYEQLIKAQKMKTNIYVWCESLSSEEERLVIYYHYLQDHNFGWIADEALHCSEKTVKRRHDKAIEHLCDLDSNIPWL